jgi:hypothetical protein
MKITKHNGFRLVRCRLLGGHFVVKVDTIGQAMAEVWRLKNGNTDTGCLDLGLGQLVWSGHGRSLEDKT